MYAQLTDWNFGLYPRTDAIGITTKVSRVENGILIVHDEHDGKNFEEVDDAYRYGVESGLIADYPLLDIVQKRHPEARLMQVWTGKTWVAPYQLKSHVFRRMVEMVYRFGSEDELNEFILKTMEKPKLGQKVFYDTFGFCYRNLNYFDINVLEIQKRTRPDMELQERYIEEAMAFGMPISVAVLNDFAEVAIRSMLHKGLRVDGAMLEMNYQRYIANKDNGNHYVRFVHFVPTHFYHMNDFRAGRGGEFVQYLGENGDSVSFKEFHSGKEVIKKTEAMARQEILPTMSAKCSHCGGLMIGHWLPTSTRCSTCWNDCVLISREEAAALFDQPRN